jgi:hypothetical protein
MSLLRYRLMKAAGTGLRRTLAGRTRLAGSALRMAALRTRLMMRLGTSLGTMLATTAQFVPLMATARTRDLLAAAGLAWSSATASHWVISTLSLTLPVEKIRSMQPQ